MRAFLYSFMVAVLLIGSLPSAEAGQRVSDDRNKKYRQIGLSFHAVVGRSKIRKHVRPVQHQPVVRGCSPRQASAIARVYGLQFQTLYRNSRTMTVVGYKRGHKTKICFSRALGCQIIG